MTLYKSTNNGVSGEQSVTMMFETFDDLGTETVTESNPYFHQVLELLDQEEQGELSTEDAENKIIKLLNPFAHITDEISTLSPNLTYSENKVFYKHDPLDPLMAKVMLDAVQGAASDDPKQRNSQQARLSALANFIEKLYAGATETGRRNLFRWIQDRDITIYPDGDFLAYKGVIKTEEGTYVSKMTGTSYVNNVLFENQRIPNAVGDVVSMPRSAVEENEDIHCGPGLHAGTYAYARGWASGGLLTVKIDPADVVSVPKDSEGQKIRTNRYTVMDLTEVERQKGVLFADDDYDDAYDDDYDDDDLMDIDDEGCFYGDDDYGFSDYDDDFEETDPFSEVRDVVEDALGDAGTGVVRFTYHGKRRVVAVEDYDGTTIGGTVLNEPGEPLKRFSVHKVSDAEEETDDEATDADNSAVHAILDVCEDAEQLSNMVEFEYLGKTYIVALEHYDRHALHGRVVSTPGEPFRTFLLDKVSGIEVYLGEGTDDTDNDDPWDDDYSRADALRNHPANQSLSAPASDAHHGTEDDAGDSTEGGAEDADTDGSDESFGSRFRGFSEQFEGLTGRFNEGFDELSNDLREGYERLRKNAERAQKNAVRAQKLAEVIYPEQTDTVKRYVSDGQRYFTSFRDALRGTSAPSADSADGGDE